MSTMEKLVTKVDFVGTPTRDFDAAVNFYENTLGLECSVCNRERHYAEFETGNVTLSVWDPQAMGMEHKPSPNPIALHVEDMEAARATLQERGVTFNADTLDTGVCHMAFFSDPDGNALMLHHRYAPRDPS